MLRYILPKQKANKKYRLLFISESSSTLIDTTSKFFMIDFLVVYFHGCTYLAFINPICACGSSPCILLVICQHIMNISFFLVTGDYSYSSLFC